MTTWLMMALTNLLFPLVMIGFGALFCKKAPDEINPVFGYRTAMSMINRDTWETAHKLLGRVWLVTGLVLLLLNIAVMACLFARAEETVTLYGLIAVFVQLFVLLLSILPVEWHLHKTFDKNGNRK